MAIAYNKVILVGRLTRDPDIRSTVSGSSVANFSLAVDRMTKDNDAVDFINIVAFGKQAEFASNYLSKGKLILVEGSLHINRWTDRNDIKRETAEIWASRMNFMETKKSQEEYSQFNNLDIKVEDGYKNNPSIDSIDDDILSDEMPEFEDPFSDLEDDLSSDEKPI
ncbi:single-stranded DNA-binding protein [Oceanotoga sp. DSM 15011]|jgi:single-strand DNA-binding protein|uniref:Single-stranded DNA-binding protein n=1 Tax=Oceanotoga teriensis TaxID=515440 RepID=A0AA45C901_9BACT|nr:MULTISPECIES: single-stranded DNA-binding protein [Oceanotoga]MDN5341618.1 single-strand DNA-binding protein [Oceanotoga sp.]MDO7977179.1 single-stranded DNA-binding protein [Oceanotoga teriensis]PWJ96550.1 single-strand binding protein [Oceanotoga teriensis]UYP00276.1 single-stranded DNA-binding protein [Oceanotoga sp. DSM 15011]